MDVILSKIINSSLKNFAFFLLFLMVAFPMVLSLLYVKAALFIILLLVAMIQALKIRKLTLHPQILLWTLFLSSVSLFFSLKGLIAGAPGALKQAQVFALWPILYTVLISGATKNRVLSGIYRTLIFSTIFIGVYACIFVLTELKVISQFIDLNFFDEEKVGFGLYEGYTKISFMGLNSLPFLIPFTMSALAINYPEEKVHFRLRQHTFSRIWLWVALILGLAVVIASGRHAILLVTILSPIVILVFSFFQPGKLKQATRKKIFFLSITSVVVILILLFYLNMNYGISLSSLYNMFVEGFDFGSVTNESASIRRDQFYALMNGWYDSPLLGSGHGASAPGYIRDPEMPWAYELYYIALLYQVGLFGFLIYTIGIIWIYYMALKIIKKGGYHGLLMMPITVGLTCYLIANATNPYLVRFDGIWVIFYPIAIINSWLLNNKQSVR